MTSSPLSAEITPQEWVRVLLAGAGAARSYPAPAGAVVGAALESMAEACLEITKKEGKPK